MEHVSPIEWNDEGFKNIAIDPDRKLLVQSLVESHAQDQPFDDFVQGKGLGLVINLFGASAATSLFQFLNSELPRHIQGRLVWARLSRSRQPASVRPLSLHWIEEN